MRCDGMCDREAMMPRDYEMGDVWVGGGLDGGNGWGGSVIVDFELAARSRNESSQRDVTCI
jgi:hypothetical protein